MKVLTERQRQVLDFIAQYTEEHVAPPTVREIGEKFNISLRAVQDHVQALQKKGYIDLTKKKSRSIRVLRDERETDEKSAFGFGVKVPLVSSTQDFDVQQNYNVVSEVPFLLSTVFNGSTDNSFAYKITTNGMSGDGIFRDDIAIFSKAASAPDGKIVLIAADEALLVGRIYNEDSMIRLESSNPQVQPVHLPAARVVGILSHIIRSY